MAASMVVAGVFNSQRAKASDKVFSWMDFHPEHAGQPRKTGAALVRKTVDWFPASEVQWLPGYGPEVMV
jgi:hypothetical protein